MTRRGKTETPTSAHACAYVCTSAEPSAPPLLEPEGFSECSDHQKDSKDKLWIVEENIVWRYDYDINSINKLQN